jgi:hypothetical protein
MVVLLTITAPASFRRAAGGASAVAGFRSTAAVPSGQRVAARGDVFLDGDRHAVERAERLAALPARLEARACASAASGLNSQVACRCGSQRSICASTACVTSTGDSFFSR